jgi:response regulator RpfG family c-di-GMP phosphodiesterase
MRCQPPTEPSISFIISPVMDEKKYILHIGSREMVIMLRDQILRLHGFEVISTLSLDEGPSLFQMRPFDLVLVDVEGQGRVPQAEKLCAEIRELHPGQRVAFVCNYLVSIQSDCPDEIIEAEFNPEAFVDGVRKMLE